VRLIAREEYGLRCLLQVARSPGRKPIAIPEIADSEGLSPEYAGRLLQVLRHGGLVTSSRGPAGGYRLARRASEISIREVLDVLGGALFPEDFCECHPGRQRDCLHSTNCSLRALWRGVDGLVREYLHRISLADLLRDEQSMSAWLGTAASQAR
jgi:Rrf2 family protein